EQEYNSYDILDDFLNASNDLPEDLDNIPVSNLFDPNYTNNSYNSSYSLLNSEYSNSSYIGQDSSFNNTLFRNNWVEPETPHTFGSPSTSIKYNPEKEYTLLELNSTNLACNNIQPENISTNPMPYSPPACSENKELSRITKSLESTQTTSTSIDGKQKNQNSESAISYISTNINYNTVNELKKISFITSSIRNSDEYKSIVTALHDYKLKYLEDVKTDEEQEKPSILLYFDFIIDSKSSTPEIDNTTRITDQYNNVWAYLCMSKKETIKERISFIWCLCRNPQQEIKMFENCNLSYYPGILIDLNIKCASFYNIPKKYSIQNKLVERDASTITLSDIYAKRNINILWHAESMLISHNNQILQRFSNNILQEDIEDWNLKQHLLLILCIPEIYEDLFYMKYEDIGLLKQKILVSTFNKKYENIWRRFCIIKYLYGKVHNDNIIMRIAYKNILNIKIKKSIRNCDGISVYETAFSTFAFFYKYSLHLYTKNTKLDTASPSFLDMNKNSCPYMRKYTKMHLSNQNLYQGKNVILAINTKMLFLSFKYNRTEKKSRVLDKIKDKETIYAYNSRNYAMLSYTQHYHVQLVDNSTHCMHVIHLPFFVTTENGTISYHYIHTIEEIAKYIIDTFYAVIINSNKNPRYTIYPFKYSRKDKTWSMITRPEPKKDQIKKRRLENSDEICDMDKTVEEMHNDGFDVVFYYMKKNIEITEFVFAQFNPIDAETINAAYRENEAEAKKLFDGYVPNNDAPRIPLFLPRLMTSAVHFGPYVLKPEKYKIISNEDYQNPIAVEFFNWLDVLVKRKDLKLTTIELLKKFRHEIYYYSDFYILGLNTPYEDCGCYGMEFNQKELKDDIIEMSWTTKKQLGIGEYNNYSINIKSKSQLYTNMSDLVRASLISSFLQIIQRKHVSQDMLRYGVCIYTKKNMPSKIFTVSLLCSEMKTRMEGLFCEDHEMHHMLSPRLKENTQYLNNFQDIDTLDVLNISKLYITIKEVNYTKSKLGLHYTILNSLFNSY
ncbi:hypothetical protein NEPAR03_2244, partial [Nematocida parisii]